MTTGKEEIEKHPVSNVVWVDVEKIQANDYNPNKVAPPEMKLLELSIQSDGYTQPIVTWLRNDGMYEVVDGFHRHLVGKKMGLTKLPIVVINKARQDKGDRISSTIRHNRARGKHVVQAMSEIVIELKNRNWKNERIARELGMEEDEVLRLCQITGLASLFKDEEFSKSWDIKDSVPDDESETLDEIIDKEEKDMFGFRTVNTNDPNRIFHTHDKWECAKAGFYNSSHPKLSKEECEQEYAKFLKNDKLFRKALRKSNHPMEIFLRTLSYKLFHEPNRMAWASFCLY